MPTTIPPEGPVDDHPLNKIGLPEAPAKPHRAIHPLLIGAIGVVAVIAFGMIALKVFRENPGGPGHYEGQAVSFDYPSDFHEFDLVAGWQQFAAYGPVSGGPSDYVAIFPAPPETKKIATLEDFVKWGSSDCIRLTGPAQTVDVNGLTGYMVPIARTGSNGEALEGRSILVKGEQGDYLIACQYVKQAEAQVLAGCETLMHTLVEVPAHSITNASACTGVELDLLSSMPFPEGADPREPRGGTNDVGWHYCDQMVLLPPGHDLDVVLSYFRSQMTQAGWAWGSTKKVRTFEVYDVWQLIANRNWDEYMLEVYVKDGHAHHFFVTVLDI